MKRLINTLAITFTVITTLNAQLFTLNASASTAKWTGYSEVGNYAQSGTIKPQTGTLKLEGEAVKTATIVFDAKSISHSDKKLDGHLKDKDFFYVKRYPTATFQLKKINGGVAYGDLTIRGKTHEISFPVEVVNSGNSVTVKGKAVIDRTKFDIKYNSTSYFQDLGNYAINNTFDLAFESVFVANK